MKTLSLIGRRIPGDTKWRYAMDYETACRKYKREVEDLQFLNDRLKTATISEFDRIQGDIASKQSAIYLLKRWFKFTGNKMPEIGNK